MYAHVTVRFFPYANFGARGIGCGLGNVMKTADGEPLGFKRSNAMQDFAALLEKTKGLPERVRRSATHDKKTVSNPS